MTGTFWLGFGAAGLGAFFGGCLRSLFSDWFNHAKAYLPYGTLAANLLGSLLIGIFAALVAKGNFHKWLTHCLPVAFVVV